MAHRLLRQLLVSRNRFPTGILRKFSPVTASHHVGYMKHNMVQSQLPHRFIHFSSNYNKAAGMKLYPITLLAILLTSDREDNKHLKLRNSLLHYALNGDVYSLKQVLNKIKALNSDEQHEILNCRHPYGWTPLMCAAIRGNLEAIHALIKAGADPDLGDHYTTARRTARSMRVHELDVLRERDLFSDQLNPYSNFKGFTALHYAVIQDSSAAVKALLDGNADPLATNHLGHKASEYVSEENDALYNLLFRYEEERAAKKKEAEIRERLRYPLEQRIKEHIIGQEGPIATVSSCIRRKQNGWYDEQHPLVFFFLGSSGVGKTELAKQVANYLHQGDKTAFIRLDMSEYQEKHEVAKLIGAPPGYIGHDQGGQLTKKLQAKPNAVVLFDEVDKAHPDVLTVLLQLFDEGRLTDGQGRTIECKDAIFVMTSNLASDEIAQYGARLRQEAAETKRNRLEGDSNEQNIRTADKVDVSHTFKENVVRPILKRHFGRDEFLGRINEFVYFLPFSDEELMKLVEKELVMWKEIAFKKHSVHLTWQKPFVSIILADGYNIHYGARSIKYEVDRRVVSLLASAHERGMLKKDSKVHVSTPATNEELSNASDLVKAVIQLEITSSESNQKPVVISETDVWNWHNAAENNLKKLASC